MRIVEKYGTLTKKKKVISYLNYKLDCRNCNCEIEFKFIEFEERYCDVICENCSHINKVDTAILWRFD